MVNMTQVERLVSVEVEVKSLRKDFEEHKTNTANDFREVKDKLDELIVIRNKGAGVLWLIGGAGISGLFVIINYISSLFGGK
jgi:hypothetical protein